MADFKLTVTAEGRTQQVSDFAQLSWGGSDRDAARTLTVAVPLSCLCPLGAVISLDYRGDRIFSGYIWERERETNGHLIELRCYDRGIYLKQNQETVKWRGTPEALGAKLCRDYSIPAGTFARTSQSIRRNFMGVDLYCCLMTAYTMASERTGKRYVARFRGERLEVAVKAIEADSPRLEPGRNILRLSARDSLEGLVTDVEVYDDKYRLVTTYRGSPSLRRLYGRMTQHIRQSKDGDTAGEARQILEDGGVQSTISAECLGDPCLVAGTAVVVREPQTGTNGEFWITSDRHTVERGIYRTRVDLDCRCLMDEQSAGTQPAKKD